MIGTKIGQYQVLRVLGKGGMGEVYEAVDDKLGRHVAIKLLLPRYAEDPEIIARFFNEARAVNLIGHPGLVQVFEFGELPTGGAFMVMEYIPGLTLRDRLKQSERMAEMEALQIALQLASALMAAHAKDIVHRDLKPGNVMLVQDPTMALGQRVKLLDFGVAKLGAQSAREEQPRTKTGLSIGTPTYMSPEQCRGLKSIDGRSDVYALGVMLFEMLAGRLPFDGESEGAILGMHMYEEPAPLLSYAPGVSASVAALVHRMLNKKADERPTAAEVVEVLTEMAAAVVPSSARPSTKLATVGAPPRVTSDHMVGASTLGRGVGQLAKMRSLQVRHAILRLSERWPWLAERTSPRARLLGFGAMALLVTLGITAGLFGALRRPAAPVTTAAKPPAKVHWTVKSTPPGATVLRASDESVLGQTPWNFESEATTGQVEVKLRLPGYKDRAVTLSQEHDTALDEALEASAPAAAAAEKSEPSGKKGGRRAVAHLKDKDKSKAKAKDGDKEIGKKESHGSRTKLID